MSMNDGVVGASRCEINVTPMIDVLLVLLIIFMVIVSAIPKGEAALVPKASTRGDSRNDTVILEGLRDAAGQVSFWINHQAVGRADLGGRLATIYAQRAQRVLFVKGDDELKFTEIAEVIDISRAAGVDHVGLLTPRVAAGL